MKSSIIKYLFIFISISIALIAFGLSDCCTDNPENANAASSSTQETSNFIKLKIDGMFCGSCAYSAKIALQGVKFVKKAEVTYSTGIAEVYPEQESSVDLNKLIKSVEKLGYKARLIK